MKHLVLSAAAGTSVLMLLAACSSSSSSGSASGSGSDGDSFTPRGDVTMVVPFSAGGGSDLSGRALAGALEAVDEELNVNVENRDGGSGAVGYSYFLGQRGNPQVLLATETSLLSLPLTANVEFDYTDFTPIMKVAEDYTLMVAAADAPYETCADVVDEAKGGRVVAGIAGATGLDNIVFTLTEQQTGAKFDRVPFESGGELVAALMGGQIDIASLNPGEVLGQLESGDLKALCAYAEERYDYEQLADIETAKEQGIDVAFAQFRGLIAPGDISDAEKEYWVEQMEAVVETEEYDKYIEENVLQPNTAAGDEFVSYLESNNEMLKAVLEK